MTLDDIQQIAVIGAGLMGPWDCPGICVCWLSGSSARCEPSAGGRWNGADTR